ncbi:MAG TPA: YIP1 family protein [Thermoanaerobaculia bacterium]|nr:YIP1 family protein [Thermoanaerobaculia bacterium]
MEPELNDPSTSPSPQNDNAFQRLAGVLIAPVETLRSIAARPTWLVALILITLIGVATSFIVAPKLDLESGMRAQFEKQGGMSEEQIDQAIAMATTIKKFSGAIAAFTTPVTVLIIAALFLLIFKVFGGEGGFGQFFAVTVHAWLPQTIKGVLLTVIIAFRESVPVEQIAVILKSNLGFLSDPQASPMAFAFLSSLDVFTIWTLFLMIVGFSFVSRMKRSTAVMLVGAPWLVVLLFKVAFAALQGGMG